MTARVALGGDARPSSGDLEGRSDPVSVDREAAVQIRIDRRVP